MKSMYAAARSGFSDLDEMCIGTLAEPIATACRSRRAAC